MSKLSVERLFSDPPLTGTLPTSIKFSPDGSFIAFLRTAEDDRERQDLWRLDVADRSSRCWLDARKLSDSGATLTLAEKAERERKRQFANGITRYEFSPDGRYLLLPVDGAGYLLEISGESLKKFTPDQTRQTDFQFSPTGAFISYVRGNNLYYFDIAEDKEHQVTDDGNELVSYGIADFIAQEEMHRFEGHWWSPDESSLAFTRVDESPIRASQRYEIDADEFNVIEQRYPYAGEPNAEVALKVLDRSSGTTTDIDWRHAADDYLARVNWSGRELAVQSQSRNQQSLRLDFIDPDSGTTRHALHETSETWLNLHDNFKALDGERFLWTSERDGHSHLYLYSNGEPHQLTSGDAHVERIVHVGDERVLVSGWFDSPTEQHLYSIPLALDPAAAPARITREAGWHDVTANQDGSRVIDRVTSLQNPGSIQLVDVVTQESTEVLSTAADHPYQPYMASHCSPELGELQAEDGQTLHYRLTRPQSQSAPVPLVVHVYGGPGVQRVKNEWAPLTVQLFAQNGFGVLELDNRGSSSRGRSFEAPIYRHMGRAEVADQLVGARFAQSLDWVDGERIGVFGHSYGGYMTIKCLAEEPEVFKAGVSVAPVTDWRLYDTHYTERYLSTPSDNTEGYRDSSVLNSLDNLDGKLLIIHGMADDNVLFTNSTKLFKALQQRNIAFEMMTYPGSKHALQERSVSIHRFNLILAFFQRHLGTSS